MEIKNNEMKKKILALSLAVIGAATLLTSFRSEAGTCSITATVTLYGAPISESLVGVSTSADNRDNSIYIAEKETNSAGKITFTNLAPGTYYLDAFHSTDESDFWSEMTVTVSEGTVEVAMKLEEANYDEE